MRRRTTGDHFNRKSSHLPHLPISFCCREKCSCSSNCETRASTSTLSCKTSSHANRGSSVQVARTVADHEVWKIERAPEPAVPDPLYAKAVQRREPWLFRTGCPHRRRPHPLEDSPHPPRPRGCRLSRGSPPQMDSPPPAPSCFVPVLQVTRGWGGLA